MDFQLDEDLQALQSLAAEIFSDLATTERVREVETTDERVDTVLWSALAGAGLLGLAVPEEADGAGLGIEAACVVLEEQGRTVAPVPLWSHLVAGLVVAAHGTEEQKQLLSGIADGSVRVALALEEFDNQPPATPGCAAVQDSGADRWRLRGVKAAVPTPLGASPVRVSATGPDGPGLFLVANEWLAWESSTTTTHDLSGHLTLEDTPAERLAGSAGEPADALTEVLQWSAAALAAVQLGVADGAMRLAASYTSDREQFGRPLGSFQAVQHQLADCWIDIEAMRVTLWQALSSITESGAGSEAARKAVLTATWWREQAGLDVVHRVQHVHGGIGVDVDYPVHRHFLWGRQIANTLGGAAATLADLGDLIAEEAS
ncbi:MAG: acyl-CoA/acyl-ACP dehydrogenase [Nocardioides sp.]|nr:acyl-CoA/acyl-ACP dehydrogenase [Nocardioides sp.]